MTPEGPSKNVTLEELVMIYGSREPEDVDIWLLKDNLKKTPWERMQANDDAVNFGDLLRARMRERMQNPNKQMH